jgi:hypothetical protein
MEIGDNAAAAEVGGYAVQGGSPSELQQTIEYFA